MAGQLGWTPLSAGDLGTAVQALQASGADFGKASSVLSDSLGNFNQAQSNINSNALLMRLQQYSDPKALQAAIGDGSLYAGLSPSSLNESAISAVGSRPGTLINNAINAETLRNNTWTDDRNMQTAALADAAAPDLIKAHLAATSGRPTGQAEANDILTNSPAVQRMRLGQVQDAVTSNLTDGSSANTLANTVNDRVEQRLAIGLGQEAAGKYSSVETLDNALNDPNGPYAKYSGPVKALIRSNAIATKGSAWAPQGGIGGAGGGGSGGGDGGDPSLAGGGFYGGDIAAAQAAQKSALGKVFYDPKNNPNAIQNLPDNVKTAGDYIGYAPTLLKSNGSTAYGLYGINAGTLKDFGDRGLLGANWQNQDIRSADFQDKVGKAIFDSTKGNPDALAGRWASLQNVTPEMRARIAAMPWEQARTWLAHGESSVVDPVTLMTGQAISDAARGREMGEVNNQALADTVDKFSTPEMRNKNIGQVADELVKQYPEIDRGTIIQRLQSVMDMAKKAGSNGQGTALVNPAMAAEFIARHQKDEGLIGGSLSAISPFGDNLGKGVAMDKDAIKKDLDSLANGDYQRTQQANVTIGARHWGTQVAQAQYQDAMAKYMREFKASQTSANYDRSNLTKASDLLERARAGWEAAQSAEVAQQPQEAFPVSNKPGQPAPGNASKHIQRAIQVGAGS